MWNRDNDPSLFWLIFVLASLLISFAVLAGGCKGRVVNDPPTEVEQPAPGT